MKKNILHKVGAFILAAVMLGGAAALAGRTAQAQSRRRVIIAPRVYVGHRRPSESPCNCSISSEKMQANTALRP